MEINKQNMSLYDIGNICHDDWKSRQHVKRQEDSYKEHVEKNPNARLLDELLNKYLNK